MNAIKTVSIGRVATEPELKTSTKLAALRALGVGSVAALCAQCLTGPRLGALSRCRQCISSAAEQDRQTRHAAEQRVAIRQALDAQSEVVAPHGEQSHERPRRVLGEMWRRPAGGGAMSRLPAILRLHRPNIVDGDKAYQRRPFRDGGLDDDASRIDAVELPITVAELEVRPTGQRGFPTRIVRVIVDPPHSEERAKD